MTTNEDKRHKLKYPFIIYRKDGSAKAGIKCKCGKVSEYYVPPTIMNAFDYKKCGCERLRGTDLESMMCHE